MKLLSFAVLCVVLCPANGANFDTYRAAVVNYKPINVEKVTLNSTLENAYNFARYAMEARWEGVDVLVFPEGGLTGLTNLNREEKIDFAQDVPNPAVNSWNPCLNPLQFENTQILHVLSCAARYNALIIVANLIGREPCSAYSSATCPSDKNFYFNTNVVFHKNGTLAARYYKRHLYQEPSIDLPPQPSYAIIDVGFMKFATFICFDIIYRDSAIDIIKEKGIKNIIFTTAWVNILPFLSAPQVLSGYSRGLGINVIAANLFAPEDYRLGSGIFSSTRGALNQTYDLSSPGKMLIADVPIQPEDISSDNLECDIDLHYDHSEESAAVGPSVTFFQPFTETNKPSSSPTPNIHFIINLSLKSFNVFYLDQMIGHVDLCKGDFCCHLDYEFLSRDETVYVFAVEDGIISIDEFQFGVQVCTVLRCEKEDKETCGRVPSKESETIFQQLSISGSFETDVVLPQMMSTDLQLIEKNWNYSMTSCPEEEEDISLSKLELIAPTQKPIMVAALIGHIFQRDTDYYA